MTTSDPRPRVFISYAREDASDANELRRLLKLADFDPWIDSSGLLSGDAWEPRLSEAIRTSDFVVALLSEHSAGGYQETELRVATDNSSPGRPAGLPFVVPILIGGLLTADPEKALPPFLDKTHIIRFVDGSWRVLHELLCTSARSAGLRVPTLLRSEPRNDLTDAAATELIVGRNFYDKSRNATGRPASDRLVTFTSGVVTDRATGRQWTAACGGPASLTGPDAATAMASQANDERLGGTDDWRLPSLDESMSLMAREKNSKQLFISEHFSDESYALTCDTLLRREQQFVWVVSYLHGDCQTVPASGPVPVRLVRTTWEHLK